MAIKLVKKPILLVNLFHIFICLYVILLLYKRCKYSKFFLFMRMKVLNYPDFSRSVIDCTELGMYLRLVYIILPLPSHVCHASKASTTALCDAVTADFAHFFFQFLIIQIVLRIKMFNREIILFEQLVITRKVYNSWEHIRLRIHETGKGYSVFIILKIQILWFGQASSVKTCLNC